MKRQIILHIMVLFLLGLAGCTGGNTETYAVVPGETAVTELPNPDVTASAPAAAELPNPDVTAPAAAKQNDNAVVRGDADGLVEVRIEGGNAELTFNLAQWDKLYGIYSIYDALEYTDPALFTGRPI